MKKLFKTEYIALFFMSLFFLGACNKDDYYEDGGLAKAEFDGTIIQYLETKPVLFDTIVQIIKLAGLENDFKTKEFTFFAPSDPDIKQLIGTVGKGGLNEVLFFNGLDTIQKLSDIDSLIWRKHLLKYMFKGKNKLADYPQVDFQLLGTYPGQNYVSMSGAVSKIGVVFNDIIQMSGSTEVARLKYKGYRQLFLSYMPDYGNPDNLLRYPVSTSDIQPTNGVIHVLNYNLTYFGLNLASIDVIQDVIQSKR
ncbi:fasciclin domain-containing protein [Sphingobacterium endophyticum]|uniref:fasciclin domain-containing protein n=1 Tax=Sphingobacterium endophyticum TaxID=2546448 RepID=UPI0012E17E7D|nr:fasciclin domain-containing protein [Sphingobacterium endophyticum]